MTLSRVAKHNIERIHKRSRNVGVIRIMRRLQRELGDDWRVMRAYRRQSDPMGLHIGNGRFMVRLSDALIPQSRSWRQVTPRGQRRSGAGPVRGRGWVGMVCAQIQAAHREYLEGGE